MGIVSERIRKQVYRKCNSKCAYCGMPVEFKRMQVDHLDPCFWNHRTEVALEQNIGKERGTDDYDNLMPSCRRCNKWKDQHDLETFRANIISQPEKMLSNEKQTAYRLMMDFGMIKVTPWDGIFYFEKMPGFSKELKRTI